MPRLTLDIPDADSGIGPAMQALNDRERAYVVALVTAGGSEVQAALAAGYGEDSPTHDDRMNAANQAAWRLRRKPTILAAMKEEAEKRLHAGVVLASEALIAMVKDPLNKHHFKAVDRLLAHSGLIIATRHEVDVKHTVVPQTDEELLARIKVLSQRIGVDPATLLPAPIDAEFTVVDTAGSMEGLEDLL